MVDLIHDPAVAPIEAEPIDIAVPDNEPMLEDEQTGERYELIEGELVTMARTDNEHGAICARISYALINYSKQVQAARVTSESSTFYTRFDDKTVRKPDVSLTFFNEQVARNQPSEFYMRVPPDLVVEVISPGNGADEIESKTQEWFTFGVRQVWLIYPEGHRVHVWPDADHSFVVRGEGSIDGQETLPGFTTPIPAFFQD